MRSNKEVVLGSYLNAEIIENRRRIPQNESLSDGSKTADEITSEEWLEILGNENITTKIIEELFSTLLRLNGEGAAGEIARLNEKNHSVYNSAGWHFR